MVELALIILPVALLVFSAIDVGRMAHVQNRLANAAREGSAVAQMTPGWVAEGCHGDQNISAAIIREDPKLPGYDGFTIKVETADGTPITGCEDDPAGMLGIQPGDRIIVRVSARVNMTTPLTGAVLGDPKTLTRTIEVVVQG